MTMAHKRYARTHTWFLRHVQHVTYGRSGMGCGVASSSPTLVRGCSTFCTEVVCEAMDAIPWHDDVTTNINNSDE